MKSQRTQRNKTHLSVQRKRQPHEGEIQIGTVKRHPDGFGFFIPDHSQLPDIYISRQEMEGVMGNDRVKVLIRRKGFSARFYGQVLDIVERAHVQVAGTWEFLNKKTGILRDHSHTWGEDIKVVVFPKNIQEKDWVSVRILTYPRSKNGLTGEVKKVIKDHLHPKMDVFKVLHTHSIPYEFPSDVLKEVRQLPKEVTEKDITGRKDLRHLDFVTIDGKTAKDFDDAFYVQESIRGFKLYVAIADVGHYVKPGSAIDKEAFLRGNSLYFPGFVVPMLPEKLSNELCSLQPRKARLVMVMEVFIDQSGKTSSPHFYSSIIESKARVNYGEAQDIIDESLDQKRTLKCETSSQQKKVSKKFSHTLQALKQKTLSQDSNGTRGKISLKSFPLKIKYVIAQAARLAEILIHNRRKRGALDLNLPETEVEIDERGEPVDIITSKRLFSHCMIEELMLVANTEVAKFLFLKKKPFLYRVHAPPLPEDIEQLNLFLKAFGFSKKLKTQGKGEKNALQKNLNAALQYFANTKHSVVLSLLVLRVLSQAKYDVDNEGHFGLSLDQYTHFTSPIRRYSDLSVHRRLKSLLSSTKKLSSSLTHKNLKSKGTSLSACEQRSLKAERQFLAVKKARFLFRHIGESFEGMISAVKNFGVFVMLRDFDVDGLVHVEDLKGGFLEYDEKFLRLFSPHGSVSYAIGDDIKIKVAEVKVELGKIKFVPA